MPKMEKLLHGFRITNNCAPPTKKDWQAQNSVEIDQYGCPDAFTNSIWRNDCVPLHLSAVEHRAGPHAGADGGRVAAHRQAGLSPDGAVLDARVRAGQHRLGLPIDDKVNSPELFWDCSCRIRCSSA